MMDLRLLCVGKLKEAFYTDAVKEYSKRLTPFCRLEILELPEQRLPDRPSQAQIQAALKKEGEHIAEKLLPGSVIVALCVEGKLLSSEQWAAKLQDWMVQGRSKLTLILGSSYGLHPDIKARAQLKLSMSPMTFPHHLARVMILEQLYRAFQIQGGSPYHK